MKNKSSGWLIAMLLFFLTAAVFAPTLFCHYVALDDSSYVSKNPHVLSGLSLENIRWAFHVQQCLWSPLLWISYMFDSTLLASKPWAFHLTNLLLHSLNASLLFLLLRRMTGKVWLSLIAAVLWSMHPLRVESVAWIAERKDVLSAFFMFLALHAYILFLRSRSKAWYASILLFMVAGLMVKPMLVTLPVLLLLFDVWPLGNFSKHWKPLVVEKIPLFICSAVFTVTSSLVLREAISSLEIYSLSDRVGIALYNYVFYIGKFCWPFGLASPYSAMIPSLLVASGAFVLLTGITLFVLLSIRRMPFIFTGWFWFCIALTPVCGFIQIGNVTAADRYTYLPSIGLTVALVWGVAAFRQIPFKKEIALILAAGLILLTVRQISFWLNSGALFSRALAVTENNPVAHALYGGWLVEEGRLDDAAPHLFRAVSLAPGCYTACNNLGLYFLYRGDFDRAKICFEAACNIPGIIFEAKTNLEICRLSMEKKSKCGEEGK
jgi:tetratricopeptide (TPR) repeat protein